MSATIPLSFMQVAKLPVHMLDAIKQYNRKFFWGKVLNERKVHSIAWEHICKLVAAEELCIKRLRGDEYSFVGKVGVVDD